VPLRDHFHPPLSLRRPWEGIHGAWTATIAGRLNQELLPADYFAMPLITVGGKVEIDVATFQERRTEEVPDGAVATAVYAPPKPALSADIDFVSLPAYEVLIHENLGGPQLRAAIEIVSPANKDRPRHRQALAIKCAAYLQRGVAVAVIDVVSERTGNVHENLRQVLELPEPFAWQSATGLYACSYRAVADESRQWLDAWTEELEIGATLPTLPLWLAGDLCVPLLLEETYETTCLSLRIQD